MEGLRDGGMSGLWENDREAGVADLERMKRKGLRYEVRGECGVQPMCSFVSQSKDQDFYFD